MRALLICFVVFLSTSVLAEESFKHQISFGNDLNSGWSSTASTADTDSSLGIGDFEMLMSNISLTYMHSVTEQLQLGLSYDSERDEADVDYVSSGTRKIREHNVSLYLLISYNFNKDLRNSYFVGAGIGKETYKDETDFEDGSQSETNYDVNGRTLFFGKRFDLDYFGIKNLTYSPMVRWITGEVEGDLEDAGLEEISGATIDFIKFDLLF